MQVGRRGAKGRIVAVAAAAGVMAAAAAVVAPARGAWAATGCPLPAGADPHLAATSSRVRLLWIDDHLNDVAARGRRWAWLWAAGIGAGGVGSLVAVPFVAAADRVDWYTGAVTAAIGVVPLLVSPLAVTRDAPKLHAAIAAAPLDDDGRLCALLADAERKLAADAADQKWQQGWWMHAGNVVFNAGVTLFLGLGYHHWLSGIVNGASGVVVGEAIILTQPGGTIDDLAAYRRGELGDDGRHAAATPPGWGWLYHATF